MHGHARLLVYRERTLPPGWPDLDALWRLAGQGGAGSGAVTTTFTNSAAELEAELKQKRADILVLALDDQLAPELENTLEKCRNFSQARGLSIMVLARALDPDVIERLIQLRAFWIYLEPVHSDVWMQALERLLKLSDARPTQGELSSVGPLDFDVLAFGRIGKVHTAPPGALELETSLHVRAGDVVEVSGTLTDLLKEVTPQYRVKERHEDNIYYRFDSRLELEPLFDLKAEDWHQLLGREKEHWSAPKTKLLWITSDYSIFREGLFDKNLFSVYTESPRALNLATLNRIAPRILLVTSAAGDTVSLIETWRTGAPHPPGLIISSFDNSPEQWRHLPCFIDNALSDPLTAELRAFLLKRIPTSVGESRFLSRNSIHSRVHSPLRAKLIAISHRYFAFTCPHDFQMPSALRLELTEPGLQGSQSLYGRTLSSEYVEGAKLFRITCEWLPHCDDLARILPDYKKILKTGLT